MVAIGRAVVYFARASHAFGAGIKYRHCKDVRDPYQIGMQMQPTGDCRLKDGRTSTRTCTSCDTYMAEDLNPMVMQCECTSQMRNSMYEDIFDTYYGAS